jgi:hypothetical protein
VITPAPNTSSSLDDEHSSNKKLSNTIPYVVEEMDDDEKNERPTKRSKPHPNRESKSRASTPDIVIEELDENDVQAPVQKPQTSAPPSIFGASGSGPASQIKASGRSLFPTLKPTVPKEPSKLRFSYQPDVGSPSAPPAPAPVASRADAPPPPAHAEEKSARETEGNIEAPKKPPKEAALAMPKDALPTFVFSVTIPLTSASTPSYLKAMEQAKSAPKSSLPSFDFSPATLKSKTEAQKPVPPPVKAFDWGAAGMKKPASSSSGGGGSWSCSTCMLSNPATATDKCTICQTPR